LAEFCGVFRGVGVGGFGDDFVDGFGAGFGAFSGCDLHGLAGVFGAVCGGRGVL